jgi:hypothetical protein
MPSQAVGSVNTNSGLIQLQRWRSDAVAAQRRCIPKCSVKKSAVIITASVCPKMCGGEYLDWRIFVLHLISLIFYHQSFAPIGLQKTIAASGWLVKYLSVHYCDILTPTDAETQKYLATEKYY